MIDFFWNFFGCSRMDLVRVLFVLSFVQMTCCAIVPASKSLRLSPPQIQNCTTSDNPTTKCNNTIPSPPNRRNSLLFTNKRRSRIRQFKNSISSTLSPTTSTKLSTIKTESTTMFPPTLPTVLSTKPPTILATMTPKPPTMLPTIPKKLRPKPSTILPTLSKKQSTIPPAIVKTKPLIIKRRPSKRHHDLQLAPSYLSEISINYPYLSKPLAMHKRPAGKSDIIGLGVMPPRGSPAAKGPFKPAVIYKGLIRKQKPGMQFKRTPNGPPPLPPPMPPHVPELPMPKGREISIPSEYASQFSEADPNSGSYKFGYDTGTIGEQSYRYEKRDPDGKVTGKYGYIDPEGVLREVNYVADAFGYRPTLVNRYRVDMNFPFIGPVPSKLTFS